MKGQLRLSRPAQRVPEMKRLTRRQHELLTLLRNPDGAGHVAGQATPWRSGVTTKHVGRVMGYASPREALERLVVRGLVVKVRRGVYRAVVLRERAIAYDQRDGSEPSDR